VTGMLSFRCQAFRLDDSWGRTKKTGWGIELEILRTKSLCADTQYWKKKLDYFILGLTRNQPLEENSPSQLGGEKHGMVVL